MHGSIETGGSPLGQQNMTKKILSIDDEKIIRMIMQTHLNSAGYDVTTTDSGTKGIELAAAQTFDLIFCDIKLKGESGLDIIKALKTTHTNIPIVAATGFIGDEIIAQIQQAGADGYIAKPFTKKELIATVGKHLSFASGHA